MMFIINILLLVGIIVYSFRKSIKTQYLNTKNENKTDSLDNTELDNNEEDNNEEIENDYEDNANEEQYPEDDLDNRLSD